MRERRIVVIGTSGSGKTTLAKTLARRLGLKYVELDELHWAPDWVEVPDELMRRKLKEEVAGEAWVVDGNYVRMRDQIWSRAELIVWLNYPFRVVFWRALRRTIGRILRSETLWHGNKESWRMLFSKESIMLWVIQSHFRRASQYGSLLLGPEASHVKLIRFRSPREADRWLETVRPLRVREEA
ncbi:MAG TPA: AAA family ATPase [Candidatus Kapabacteria bacterium]|nr:AAA family ATPase [Candidatus Kapabacteria bacterium]